MNTDKMVSINVLIITYNQDNVLSRTLNSVLNQKAWGLNEIVICDDHSTDDNWGVIQSYVERYPGIVRAYRNDPNLGIYGNVEKTYKLRGKADLYVNLSGDDSFCDGYFETLQNYIENNNISVKGKAVAFSFDYKIVQPNGRQFVYRNIKANGSNNLFSLKYRGLISSRGLMMSGDIMNQYKEVPLDKGVPLAEHACEIQGYQHADVVYYIPFVASIYYSQIGVSTTMRNVETYQKYLFRWHYFLDNFELSNKDKAYTKMKIATIDYYNHPSVISLLQIIKYFCKSYDFRLGISFFQMAITIRGIVKSTFSR